MKRVLAIVISVSLAAAACTNGGDGDGDVESEASPSEGFVDEDWFNSRARDYLSFATEEFDPASVNNIVAHAARAEADPSYEWPAEEVTVESLQAVFDDLDAMKDTSDFDLMYLLNLWYGYRDQLSDEVVEAIEERILGFRYWYTEPLGEDEIDHKWFWSENHRIIFHVIEYLAGQAFPDSTFRDGTEGSDHLAHAEPLIRAWIDERARYGFSEWHSNVYMQKDVVPLVTLVEWSDDEELSRLASMALDVALFDIAAHNQAGTYGATHGRSYMKDKNSGLTEDTFGIAKLLFDDTEYPWQSHSDAGALYLATSERYRLPEAIRQVGISEEVSVDKERHGVPLDPHAPVEADPEPPYGIAFDDPENLAFWWSMGALSVWQVVPLTLETTEQYGLWETDLFKPYSALRTVAGSDPVFAQQLAQSLASMAAFGLLSEVDTYTWRAPDVMLSTAQDYRAGDYGQQYHAWQATLDANALVFTTHPSNEPLNTEWEDDDGYWTGTASMPRSAQHESAAIHIYSPQYEPQSTPPLDSFDYEPYTHAYFPTEHFDEVVQEGNWTIGRKGDGYVALWSYRPVVWRDHDPNEVYTGSLTGRFDLVAEGGPDNVWVVEVGRSADYGEFESFVAAVTSREPAVTPLGEEGDASAGFDVSWESPSVGELTFGWDSPLTVEGEEVPIHGYARVESPWAAVPHLEPTFGVEAGDHVVELDFEAGTREVSGPR